MKSLSLLHRRTPLIENIGSLIPPIYEPCTHFISHNLFFSSELPRFFSSEIDSFFKSLIRRPSSLPKSSRITKPSVVEPNEFSPSIKVPRDRSAIKVQNFLKIGRGQRDGQLEHSLESLGLQLSEDLVLDVLQRHRVDWASAYRFFNWVSKKGGCGYTPGASVYNEILSILGLVRRFSELAQVLDEMSVRKGVFNERTFTILVLRYAAAHKIEEAVEIFYRRPLFGLDLDTAAYHLLLNILCQHGHVEAAESLLKKNEFPPDIKAMNIVLHGWFMLGKWREVTRFWMEIISSPCKPDRFTYGTFMNALTKNGKLGAAVELFQSMWKKGHPPDVTVCNCIIHALCSRRMTSEAMEVFREMNEEGCLPNVVTYNSIIGHLCRFGSIGSAYKLLGEMEQKGGRCSPNARTFGFLLKSTANPGEVSEVLGRMVKNGQALNSDLYNVILRLYVKWDLREMAKSVWEEMERDGLGPDYRSYTLMIHGLYRKGMMKEALYYYGEMESKGMWMMRQTRLLVKQIISRLGNGRS